MKNMFSEKEHPGDLEGMSANSGALPNHIAIVMDGNGRWAQQRRLPRVEGHRQGVNVAQEIAKAAADIGIKHLTLFAFSAENWNRPEKEVDELMAILRRYLAREVSELHRREVRLKFIGDREGLANDIVRLMADAEELTLPNSKTVLTLAVNYGARQDITAAARALTKAMAAGELKAEDLTQDVFKTYLQTADLPDPDLVIRTSGEQRLSNFLLWESAYSEFVFTDTLWPDFTPECLKQAVDEFQQRNRTFGALSKHQTLGL